MLSEKENIIKAADLNNRRENWRDRTNFYRQTTRTLEVAQNLHTQIGAFVAACTTRKRIILAKFCDASESKVIKETATF